MEAFSSSVRGSNTFRRGASMPTQIVTSRPFESKVTDAQSACSKVELTVIPRPSGPAPR